MTDKKECHVCGDQRELERHHCLHGTSNRQKAEQDGLWVWLCPECHRGRWGVHGYDGYELSLSLKREAEAKWLEHYGKTVEDWIDRYGKNFL